MLETILEALVPVFFGIALGYLGGWTRDLDNTHVGELNALVMDFAVPASIFATVVQASRTDLLAELPLAALLSASMLILFGATYATTTRAQGYAAPEASLQALTTSLPNYASAGLPLIAALLGPERLVSVAVAIACGSILVSPITLVILERSAGGRRKGIAASVLGAVRKPIVLAPILAIAFVLTGVQLPPFATKSLTLMGQVAGGAGLFLTGLIVSAQTFRFNTSVISQTLVSNLGHPLLVAGLAWVFMVAPSTAREAIVLAALPSGFFGILFGLRFGTASEVAGTTLIASTLLSALSLSAAIYLTAGMEAPR
jgi:malonate transporter